MHYKMPKRTSSRLAKKNKIETKDKSIGKPQPINNKNGERTSKRGAKKIKNGTKMKKKSKEIEEKKSIPDNSENVAKVIKNNDEMDKSVAPETDPVISDSDIELHDEELLKAAILCENIDENSVENPTSDIQKQSNICRELEDDEMDNYEKLFLQNFSDVSESQKSPNKLSSIQIARCERNRQKALLLRQSKLSKESLESSKTSMICVKEIASDGGFFINNDDETTSKKAKIVEELPPVIYGEMSFCLECDRPFLDSYLLTTYDYSVCDKCRDSEDKHAVITKTEARETYLLSDVDITLREPVLKCQVRKNPKHNSWGDMKLYLRLQVEQRAMEVWGTPEALEEEIKRREEKREKAKQLKFKKNMIKLRQEVRSSLFTKKDDAHVHVYGPETECGENSDDDMWQKTCRTCGHTLTFEKM